MSKRILILCDYDALYTAIELKLSRLSQAQVIRLEPDPTARQTHHLLNGDFDLMIVATVSPTSDPMSILSKASLLDRVGETPVLIISEQPSRPESDDKITHLNFPFDIDQLTSTVEEILDKQPSSDGVCSTP